MADSVGLRWYTTGTATTRANNTAVTGTSTNWKTAGIKPGDIFTTDRQVFYEIATVNSDTSITLAQAFTAANTNINYYIIRNFAATLQSELAAEISRQNAIYQTWMDGRVTEIGIEYQYYKQYKNAWVSGVSYKALDIVMYNSALYVCTQAHTSSSSITPANTAYWNSYAPAMPSGVDVFNYNNAGSHNSIYRGKNLGTEPTAAQYAAIKAGTFEDLYIGDYWQKEVTYDASIYENDNAISSVTRTIKMVIADFNGVYNSSNHIVVICATSDYSRRFSADRTTAYGQSELKQYSVDINWLNCFKAFFGEAHLMNFKMYIPQTFSTSPVSYTTVSEETIKVGALNEMMIKGCFHLGIPYNMYYIHQNLSIFNHIPFYNIVPVCRLSDIYATNTICALIADNVKISTSYPSNDWHLWFGGACGFACIYQA